MRTKVRIQSTSTKFKRWWGRLAADGHRVRRGRDGDETGDETGGSGDETGDETGGPEDETAATGGVMYMDEAELEFDEDEMAVLEGQRLVAEFRCGIY